MVSPLILTVYLIGICVVFLLQVLVYVRHGEKADRVRTLWLTPIVVLPIALYFYVFAGRSPSLLRYVGLSGDGRLASALHDP